MNGLCEDGWMDRWMYGWMDELGSELTCRIRQAHGGEGSRCKISDLRSQGLRALGSQIRFPPCPCTIPD